jgi:hypothetical protein
MKIIDKDEHLNHYLCYRENGKILKSFSNKKDALLYYDKVVGFEDSKDLKQKIKIYKEKELENIFGIFPKNKKHWINIKNIKWVL